MEYAFWGFVGLNGQGGGGFLVGVFKVKGVGSGPTRQSLFVIRYAHPTGRPSGAAQTTLCNSKKSNQKKAHNLTKIDPEIIYSLWGGFIQYILAVPT